MFVLALTWLSLLAAAMHLYLQLPRSQAAKPRPPELQSQAMAQVKSIQGDARVKEIHDLSWTRLVPGVTLTRAHEIYIAKEGKAELEFLGSKTQLRIPSQTLVNLGDIDGDADTMRRLFYLESTAAPQLSDADKRLANPAFARVHWVLKRRPEVARDLGPGDKQDGGSDNGLALMRPVKTLTRVNPKGDLNLMVSGFPAVISASFLNPSPGKMQIHGYLWNEELGVDPVWEGVSNGFFPAIPVPRRGSYVFQAISDDDSYVSFPLFVTAYEIED